MSHDGKSKFQQVTCAIQSISESATQVKTLIDGVSTGSQEQLRGVEHLAKAIAHVEKVTQSNAACAEQNAAAGVQLSAQSEAMKGIVEKLTALV